MLIRFISVLLIIILSIPNSIRCQSEVQLSMNVVIPQVIIECVVYHPKPGISLMLECPFDRVCYRNCETYCSPKCDINCSQMDFQNELGTTSRKFKFVFNGSLISYQGKWICHYGKDKSTTAFYYQQPEKSTQTKREVEVVSPTNQSKDSNNVPPVPTYKIRHENHGHATIHIYQKKKLQSVSPSSAISFNQLAVQPIYVGIILVLLCMSLIINIVLCLRQLLIKYSKSHSFKRGGAQSNFWICVYKMCWLQNYMPLPSKYHNNNLHNSYHYSTNSHSGLIDDTNSIHPGLVSQFSNNTYEYHLQRQNSDKSNQHQMFNSNNYAYMHTPLVNSNGVFVDANNNVMPIYPRSRSFNSVNAIPNASIYGVYPPQDRSRQIIYDDVAEQSVRLSGVPSVPVTNQHQILQRQYSLQPRQNYGPNNTYISSMNNIDQFINEEHSPENNLQTSNQQDSSSVYMSNDKIKQEINSRVELSKSMLTQADQLLRQADSILNRDIGHHSPSLPQQHNPTPPLPPPIVDNSISSLNNSPNITAANSFRSN